MEFTHEDIKRLYGKMLYRVEGEEVPTLTEATEEEAVALPVSVSVPEVEVEPQQEAAKQAPVHQGPVWLGQGTGMTWKMKPTAKLAILLTEAEFADRELTTRLRKAVERVGLDTSLVGFGIYPAEREFHVTDCPVDVMLLCSELPVPEVVPHWVEEKRCWFAPSLTRAAGSREAGQALLDSLRAAVAALPG